MPGSYVAHLARAIYYLKVGQASRGNLVIADTSEAQLSGMDTAFAVASQELRKSFPLDRKPLLSVFYALDIGKFGGDAAHNLELLHASVAIDPRNFIVREMYEQTLQTAWGGSTDEIRAFVAQCKRAGLPAAQMKALRSVVYADEAWIDEFDNKSYKRAAAEYLEAAKLSGDDTCVLCAGKMLAKAGDFPDSARVLTRYLARHPDSADALETRAYVYFELKRGSDAVRDCKRAAPLGDSYCQYTVGMAYTFGVYGLPKDLDAAVPWLRRAAAQGYPIAKQLLPIALAEQLAHPHPIGATRSPAS
jgi:tetratricopeptide (TPR) repeat protein